jgi:hypothetical protein
LFGHAAPGLISANGALPMALWTVVSARDATAASGNSIRAVCTPASRNSRRFL